MFVVDCSVTMAWLFADERTAFSENMLLKLGHTPAIVPAIWLLEVMNVLLVAERRHRCTEAQSTHFLETLKSLPIEMDSSSIDITGASLIHIARSYALSSYDAAYLDLALRLGYPLATLDAKLQRASQKAGVTLLT